MAYRHLVSRRDGPIERLTLNRPEVRNAFNADLIGELFDWASNTRHDATVRVVVIAGAGKSFSAGADINWMADSVGYTEEQNLRDAEAAAQMFGAINSLPMPVIGRVHGAALGGGAGLAAVCDIVVAEAQTIFGFSEVKLGIVPAVISPFVLEKIGRSAARELFLTGVRFAAARAKEIGLVHAVVPETELDASVAGYVSEILSSGPEAIAAVKALITQVWPLSAHDAVAVTAKAIAGRRVSAEGQEGLRAFLAKRKPTWSAG
jgi:methylglutaconyl-CoA hydratase